MYKKVYVDQPGYVWLTRAGIRMTELAVRFGIPSEGALSHCHAINAIRLYLSAREPQGVWESERLIKARLEEGRKGRRLPHTPDAWFTRADGQQIIGIEIELHAKRKEAYYEIHGGFGGWYFGTTAARTALRHAVEETGMRQARKQFRFQVFAPHWENGQVYPPPLL